MAAEDANDRGNDRFTTFTRHALIIVVIIALALLLWQIVHALLLAFIGMLLAVFVRALASLLQRILPVSIGWAMLIVVLVLVVFLTAFFWFAGPRFDDQFQQFRETIPNSIEQIKDQLSRYTWGEFIIENMPSPEWGMEHGMDLFSRVTGVASRAFAIITGVIIIFFTSIYFAVNPEVYRTGILALIPRSRVDRFREVLDNTAHTLRFWLIGQAVSMLAVGVLATAGLWIAGIPLAFLLGLLAGILEFIPYLGPVSAAIPGILIASTEGWQKALWALAVYVIVSQLEGHLITPIAQKQAVWLPPGLVVLAVVALGLLFGLLGAVVATPLTAVVIVWVKMLYVEDVLGKPIHIR